ncbi:hypothetical protein EV126DRAFT_43869 [Verticillium dahliae]|nr:hypothetical protein EV126DRAFT_43869 [Verticillium dahliae]
MVPSLQIDQIVQIWALGSIRLIFRLVWPVLKEIKTCVHLAEQQRRRETWQREPKQREAQKQEAELRKSTAREESKRSAKTQSTTTSQNEGGQHRHYKTPSSCQHMRWWNRKFHQRACGSCRRHMPYYTFRCPGCKIVACAGCRDLLRQA